MANPIWSMISAVSDYVSGVDTIYTPPKPPKDLFDGYEGVIAQARQNPQVIGVTAIQTSGTQSWIPVYLTCLVSESDMTSHFTVHDLRDGELIGHTIIGFHSESSNFKQLLLKGVVNIFSDQYKSVDIHAITIKAALQRYQNDYHFHMIVDVPLHDFLSQNLYRELGFQNSLSNMGRMYISNEARDLWRSEIKEHPISFS